MFRLRDKMIFVVRLLLCASALTACGGGGGYGGGNGPPPPPPSPLTGGLDARPQNISCVAPDRSQGAASVAVVDAFPNLPGISGPTKVLIEPIADPRWFVLRKSGQLVVFDPDNATSVSTYLDLSAVVRTRSEGGLLGMAFHPDYPAVPEIFLSYTRDHTGPAMRSVISRFILDDIATPSAPGAGTVEQVLIEINQDFDNHNGGDIAFGADRLLYIGLGDGGDGGDPNNRAQDRSRLLGSFLRIDVLGSGVSFPGNPYDIPSGNPDFGNAECGPGFNANDCPEIYAWGMRNPWRWSFDPPTGELWAGDVGQGDWEEIDRIELDGNYGWRCREGAHNFNTSGCGGGYIDPVAEYDHSNGDRSITGGFVYRGSAIAGLVGRYVFADFESGRIWALQSDGQGGYTLEQLASSPTGPSSFGVDQAGELYFTAYFTGRIMQLVASGGGGQDPIPDLLSDSGCVDPADITQAYAGLVPYDINAPFWSDGAVKERFIGLPDGTAMSIDADDDWDLPIGTVLVKNFRLNGQLIETRHLMRHPDGMWAGYTYEWNVAQTEATRVRGGKTELIDGQDWIFPDEAECLQCHTSVAGYALGPETSQLNRDFTYPSTGRTHNQLETLDEIMMFSSPLAGTPATLPAMPDPADMSADTGDRARAYLHTNCAQCHQPGGPTPVDIDFRYTTLLANTNACDAAPQAGDLGLVNPRIIAPGAASRSVMVARVNRRDSQGMPPLASSIVDADGVVLLSDWIDGLTGCN
ncbi:MAG: PQQ-dependent sugar dehydrogenase [Proteobacteria bacterium]|nr:PQQ-dependent sugar dehydrogenase [Pseudomonadota bacterium]